MKYAVALISFFDNENKVAVVEASTLQEAMIKAARDLMKVDDDVEEWFGNLHGKSVEEIRDEFFNGDMGISVPVEIK